MRLIEKIVSKENVEKAIRKVKSNKGAPGVDKMPVDEIDEYFVSNGKELIHSILNMEYKPKPVRRVYIPKADRKNCVILSRTILTYTVYFTLGDADKFLD